MKHIEEINISDFAPFKDFSVKCGDVNLIVGKNDTGKTRLLEWVRTQVKCDMVRPETRFRPEIVNDMNRPVITLDEIETGLHHSRLYPMWETIFTAVKEKNLQVFATTHSRECVNAFAKAALRHKQAEAHLFRLASRQINSLTKIVPIEYTGGELEYVSEPWCEVR